MSIFQNGILTGTPEECLEARNAILDGKLPVTKIIGFSVDSNNRYAGLVDIASRSPLLLENTIELTNNLSRVFFAPNEEKPNYRPKKLKTRQVQKPLGSFAFEPVMSKRSSFFTEGDSLIPINEDIKLFTPQAEVYLTLILHRGTGIVSFEEALDITNKVIGNQNKGTALGIPTDFHLKDYIRITPPNAQGLYGYRLFNGMTESIANNLWNDRHN